MPERDAIIGKLAKERERLEEHYRSLSADDLVCACTQSEAEDGAPWTRQGPHRASRDDRARVPGDGPAAPVR